MPVTLSALVAVVDRQLCDECGLCLPLCPPGAIGMRREGLLISEPACTGCHKCIAPCPVGALTMVPRVDAYTGQLVTPAAPIAPAAPGLAS